MTFVRWTAGLAVLALLASPLPVAADEMGGDDVQEQLYMMQQRLKKMEDQLASTNRQLTDAQGRLSAGGGEPDNKLLSFLNSLEFEGWVSASYFYNFRDTSNRDKPGFNTTGDSTGGFAGAPIFLGYPFKQETQSFQLDQVWFAIEKPISDEERAGFRLDMVYGRTGEILSGKSTDFAAGTGQDFNLYQGYIQYKAPLGEGVNFKMGKFGTVIGAETVRAVDNFNITRGIIFGAFQPITHVGLMADTTFNESFSAGLGVVSETRGLANDTPISNPALLWTFGWEGETVNASFNGTWGNSTGGQGEETAGGNKEYILDFIVGWNPSEKFSGYINADYINTENTNKPGRFVGGTSGQYSGYGISAAGRYAVNEKLGVAGRVEWVDINADIFGEGTDDLQVWGLTGTVDYLLTSNLQVRGEVRYDNASSGDIENIFRRSTTGTRGEVGSGQRLTQDDQVTAGVEVIYTF